MTIINMKTNVLGLALLLVLNSCTARLKVKVHTADRDEVIAQVEKDLKKELPSKFANLNYLYLKGAALNNRYIQFLQNAVENSKNDIQKVKNVYNEIHLQISEAEKLFKEEDEYLNAFHEAHKIENELSLFYNDIQEFLEKQDDLNEKLIMALRVELMNEKKNFGKNDSKNESAELTAEKKLDSIQSNINHIDKKLRESSQIMKETIELEANIEASKAQSNRLRFNLLGDPLTSFVTKKENKRIWKSTFNQTKVSTFMGDTDIAVLLRKNADENSTRSGDYNNNFTIKGVRLDAEDVIEASFKTLSQSINLFASMQMAGTNLVSNDSSTAYAQLPTEVNNTLTNLAEDDKKLAEKEKYLMEIRKMLVQKIMFEDVQGKDDEGMVQSMAEIKAFWTSLKSELNTVKSK